MKQVVVLTLLILGCSARSTKVDRKFPDDFLFGTATAAYQIEGGWNADDKGENIWDYMTHNHPEVIHDLSNGDIAADSYHNYKRDVEMMRELGLDAYRFSMAWSRILPSGTPNQISEAGVQFYNNYIDEMLKYNITPMVTLYHWDLPQKLQDLGGFTNPLFPVWFEDYARVVYGKFGDRVKYWITFNEPREICFEGYGSTTKAPAANAHGIGEYLCAKHLVVAHARAYHAYVNEFKDNQGGICGITISVNWFGPVTDSDEDKAAAELKRQAEFLSAGIDTIVSVLVSSTEPGPFSSIRALGMHTNSPANWRMYAEPIFSAEGGFPKELSEKVAQKSKEQGYPRSRMPEFTDEEKAYVSGAYDFFGVNHYTAVLVSASEYKSDNNPVPGIADDIEVGTYIPDDWPKSASSWLVQAPDSILNALSYLKQLYGDIPFYITENGWSSPPSAGLQDDDRIRYYRAALENVLDCIDAGINLRGYMAWSLMDNFEWLEGYKERFGLYQVDFSDPARSRTARKSALVYKQIIKTRTIDHDYVPDSLNISIDEGH